jgi:UDP-N-acetylmuramoylalanine--D-glutamate ligase
MRFSDLEGKAIGVWGLGREIRSFAGHVRTRLSAAHISVVVTENTADDVAGVLGIATRPVGAGQEAVTALRDCDVLVRSPGVSIYRPELRQLAADGLPITTATGLWLAERGGVHVIGITGTKGKSTTATLVHELLLAAGHAADLAGNIGRPVLDLIDAPVSDWAVVELSSYQAADLVTGPAVAAVTNLYKEHTDWHGDESTYRRDKLRLARLPGVHACVLPAGLQAECSGEATLRFESTDGWHVTREGVRHPDGGFVPVEALPLSGRHNAVNLCAALTALDAARLSRPTDLIAGVQRARALPHRLQPVGDHGGVEWVDDSISTTPESALAALEAYGHRPIVLIAGGQDRGQDYGALGRVMADRGIVVVGVPTTGHRVVAAARAAGAPEKRTVLAENLAVAVRRARELAPVGGVVLLSPAAPSYDTYRNFEERGDHFAALAADHV